MIIPKLGFCDWLFSPFYLPFVIGRLASVVNSKFSCCCWMETFSVDFISKYPGYDRDFRTSRRNCLVLWICNGRISRAVIVPWNVSVGSTCYGYAVITWIVKVGEFAEMSFLGNPQFLSAHIAQLALCTAHPPTEPLPNPKCIVGGVLMGSTASVITASAQKKWLERMWECTGEPFTFKKCQHLPSNLHTRQPSVSSCQVFMLRVCWWPFWRGVDLGCFWKGSWEAMVYLHKA